MGEPITFGPGVWAPRAACRYTVSRAGGPGGQHVNRTSSRVTLHLALAAIVGLNDQQRERLVLLAGRRVTTDGVLVIHADQHREQLRNRTACVERVADLIADARDLPRPRRATKPSRGAKQRRLAGKRATSERKQRRRDSGGQDGW